MLLCDDGLKNSSNAIAPWTPGSERISPPSRRRKSLWPPGPPFIAGMVMTGESRADGALHLSFHDIERLRMCGCSSGDDGPRACSREVSPSLCCSARLQHPPVGEAARGAEGMEQSLQAPPPRCGCGSARMSQEGPLSCSLQIHTHVHAHLHAHIHTYTHMHIHPCTHAHAYVCACMITYTCMHI